MKSLRCEDRLGWCSGYLSSFWLSLLCVRDSLIYEAELTSCPRSCKGSMTLPHSTLRLGHGRANRTHPQYFASGATDTVREQQCRSCPGGSSHFQFPGAEVVCGAGHQGWGWCKLQLPVEVTAAQWPDPVPVPSCPLLVSGCSFVFPVFLGGTQYPLSKIFSYIFQSQFPHETENSRFSICKYFL